MKRLLAIIFLAAVLFIAWWAFSKKSTHVSEPKQEAIKITRHSKEFNQSISDAVNDYLSMKNAFVSADTVNIKMQGQKFNASVDKIKLDNLQKDDSAILLTAQQFISNVKVNAEAMLLENDLTEMRQDFRMVSDNLYPFLKTIGYEGPKLYWQNCPTAFGENIDANWLSDTSEIINPYFSKNHPGDKAPMSGCGETKDSLK